MPPAPDRGSLLQAESLFPNTRRIETSSLPPFPLKPNFTGRSEVLESLEESFHRSVEGSGLSFSILVGQAGMGKSRTIKELASTVADSDPSVRFLVGNCQSNDTRAYAAIAVLLASRFGILASDPDQVAHEKLIASIAEVVTPSRVTEISHLLAHLMRRPFPDSQVVSSLADSHQQLEVRTFLALKRFCLADAQAGPLVLCFENLEQADPGTINLLHFLVSGLASSRIMLVGTATSELFQKYPHFGDTDIELQRIEMKPLSAAEAESLFRQLCRTVPNLPPSLIAHAATLGGSPRGLFELVRFFLESGIIARSKTGWQVDTLKLQKAKLPQSHIELVAARLKCMPKEDLDVLERAAVVGETFWLDAAVALIRAESFACTDPDGPTLGEIAAAGDHTKVKVNQVLSRLVAQEWLVRVAETSKPGEREYRFAYPFLWSKVYDSTSAAVRELGHHRTAQWLELRPNGRGPVAQEAIGCHLELANDVRGAVKCFRRAADYARENFFNDKAIRLYSHALECLGQADQAARIHLWHDLGSVYELRGDYDPAVGAFERMLRLSWICASRTKAAVAFNKMGRVWRKKGDLKLALDYLSRGQQLFEQAGDERGIAGSLDDIGQVQYLQGNFEQAYENVTAGLQRRGKGGNQRSIAHSLSTLGNIQRHRGRLDEALNCNQEALDLRRATGDRAGIATSLNNLAIISYERGHLGMAREGWEQALKEAEAIGALPLQAHVLANLGEIALDETRHEEAHRRLGESIAIAHEIADLRLEVEATRNMARLECLLGNPKAARECAHRAHTLASDAGLRDFEGRTLLTLAEVLGGSLFDADQTDEDLIPGNGEPNAEAYYQQGINLLQSIGNDGELAKGLESYGRYKIEQGDSAGGKLLLERSLDIFTRLNIRDRDDLKQIIASL